MVRMIGYGHRWDMDVRGDSGSAWGGLFDPELMDGATVYLDAEQMQLKGEAISGAEILAERKCTTFK